MEAAAIDGAGPIRRFFRLSLPLIAPVSFFLLVVSTVYAFFDTFPVIDAATAGGPVQATTTLIYKIYREGFTGTDLGVRRAVGGVDVPRHHSDGGAVPLCRK